MYLQNLKRVLAMLLCAAMLFTAAPFSAFAAEADEETTTPTVVETEPVESVPETDPVAVTDATDATVPEETEAPEEEPVPEDVIPQEAEGIMALAEGDVAQIGDTFYPSFEEALAAAVDGDTIVLLADVTLGAKVTINKSLTLVPGEGLSVTIRRGAFTPAMFQITAGTLTLSGNLTVDGAKPDGGLSYGAIFHCTGSSTLVMNEGVTLQNNEHSSGSHGGAVSLEGGPTFIMNGGTITHCGTTSTANTSTGTAAGGGAVRMIAASSAAPTMVMNGGTIEYCYGYRGGAILLLNNYDKNASVTINGGSIVYNRAGKSQTDRGGEGAAIFTYNKARSTAADTLVTINGGEIAYNVGNQDGALGMNHSNTNYNGGMYHIFGGWIHDNDIRYSTSAKPSAEQPGLWYGESVYVQGLSGTGEALLTIGGNAIIEGEMYINTGYFDVREDFTGSADFYCGIYGAPMGTVIAHAVTADGSDAAADVEIAGRVGVTNALFGSDGNFQYDEKGNIVRKYSLALDPDNANQYILGEYVEPVVTYTVTYTDGVNGAAFEAQAYTVEEGEASPAFDGEPVRPGYTFNGWEPAVAETVTADAVYTATWTVNRYEVTFDVNGGQPPMDDYVKKVTFDTPYGTLFNPTKTGHTFAGWADENGTIVTSESVYQIPHDSVLTAQWEAKRYTVTLDAKGGEVTPGTYTVTYQAPVGELPVPTREGYRFDGWVDSEGNAISADTVYTLVGDTTYYATWTAYVARVESTGEYYVTLQDGLNAARALIENADGGHEAQTVTLLADTTESVKMMWVKNLYIDYNFAMTLDLNGHTVTGNGSSVMDISASGSGGAKYAFTFTVEDSSEAKTGTLTGGTASSGGAIKFTAATTSDSLVINGGNFTGNTATSGGGAIYASKVGADVIINGGVFTNNTAASGGAINAPTIVMNGGVITGNHAIGSANLTGRGGGICAWSTTTNVEITGGQIYGNDAEAFGDDIVFASTSTAGASSPYLRLPSASTMGVDGVKGWFKDGVYNVYNTSRYGEDYSVEFTEYANYKGKGTANAVGLKAAAAYYTVTYTDGANGAYFADQTYMVKDGEATPAFQGTPQRVNYEFTGWAPEVADSATATVTYVAQWKVADPKAPGSGSGNASNDLFKIRCVTVEGHEDITYNWFGSHVTYNGDMAYDEERGVWTCSAKVNINTILAFGTSCPNKVWGHDHHSDDRYPVIHLVWDPDVTGLNSERKETTGLWVPDGDQAIEVYCYTAPAMPSDAQLLKTSGKLLWMRDTNKLANNLKTTKLKADTYEVSPMYEQDGSFYCTLTITDLAPYVQDFKNKFGDEYVIDTEATTAEFVYTLKYTGSATDYKQDGTGWSFDYTDWNNTDKLNGLQLWLIREFQVTYTDGVEGVEYFPDQVIAVKEGQATPAFVGEPTRPGYTFAAWEPAVAETVTGHATYAATWTANRYIVTFDENGGQPSMSGYQKPVTFDSPYGNLINPTKTGYTFAGWQDENGDIVASDTLYQIPHDSVLVAQWEANRYTVTLDAQGGEVDPSAVTVTYEAAVGELPVPTREGYRFDGWVDGDGKAVTADTVYTVVGDSTYFATWTEYVARVVSTGVEYVTLEDAVAAAADVDTVELLKSVDVKKNILISKDLTIQPEEGKSATIQAAGYNTPFKVTGTLTLQGNLTIKGQQSASTAMIVCTDNAKLVMNEGVVLEENFMSANATEGGAITLKDNSSFVMNGGTIRNCGVTKTTKSSSNPAAHSGGGAVRTVASGKGAPTIVMNGGVIENCFAYYGGAFYLCNNNFAFDTTLTINGGVIRNCVAANAASLADATHKGEGSAIYAASKKGQAVVTINGGEITGCQADRYGVMTVGQNTDYYNVRFNIFGGHIHGNVQGASFTDIEEARGRGIFVYRLYSSKNPTTPLVTIGGNALIDDEIYLNSNADGNWLEIREDFTGRAKIHAKNEANGLLIAKAVTMDGQETTASAEILSRLTYLRNELDENGNVVTSSAYTIVKDSENENQYILASLHTVTYNDGADGVCFEEQSYVVTYGSETPAFEGELQRTGYTFTGWEPEVSETVTGDVTYTATWSQNNYTITLDPNGGSVYARFVVVHYGQPVGSLPVPVRDGYRFMGWVDENGEAVNAATVYELTTGTVYTAVWQAKTYDITVVYGNGEDDEVITATYDELVEFPEEPVRKGYEFAGWVDENGNPVDAEKPYDASYSELHADWTAKTYSLPVDLGNGQEAEDVEATYDELVEFPENPVRDGYTFGGWVDENGNPIDTEKPYDESYNEIHAVWTVNGYTVTLDPNGGKVEPTTITATYGEPVGKLPVPTREGYDFAGWLDAFGNKVTAESPYKVAGNSTFTASWTAKTYSLPVDLGNGEEAEDLDVTYGEKVEFPEDPVRDGYTFDGWVDENGNPIDTEKPYDESYGEIHASWKANTYTLHLDADGGKVEPDTLSVVYGSAIGELPVPTRKGYDFKGWYDAQGNQVTAETLYKVAGDATITAKWTAKSDIPQTGDLAPVGMYVMLVLASAAAILFLENKKRQAR